MAAAGRPAPDDLTDSPADLDVFLQVLPRSSTGERMNHAIVVRP